MGMLVFGLSDWFLTRRVCNIMIALRILRLELCAIESANYFGNSKFSRFAILHRMFDISLSWGAGTRICRHLDLSGMMTLLRLSQLAMILQLGM